jgi:hypothetical protein
LAERTAALGGKLDPEFIDVGATRKQPYIPIATPRVALRLESEVERKGAVRLHRLSSHDPAVVPDTSLGAPHFVSENSAYLIGPLPAPDLEEALLPGEFVGSLDVYYREFFDLILKDWAKDDATATLATGAADGAFVRSVMRDVDVAKKNKTKFSLRFRERVATVGFSKAVVVEGPSLKAAEPVAAGSTAKLPVVSVGLRLDFGALHEHALRKLMAGSWSSESDQAEPARVFDNGQVGRIFALSRYLAFRLKPKRGLTIAKQLMTEVEAENDAATAVKKLRLGIDRFLIASNHWAQRRETVRDGEVYQARMSNTFGT